MEAASLSETSITLHISTLCHIARDLDIQLFTKHTASHLRGKGHKHLMFYSYAKCASQTIQIIHSQ